VEISATVEISTVDPLVGRKRLKEIRRFENVEDN
jgi:hypothetical protein